jgi:hypothetical protein
LEAGKFGGWKDRKDYTFLEKVFNLKTSEPPSFPAFWPYGLPEGVNYG